MFVVIFLNFFVGNRRENFVRNFSANDFQGDFRRLRETGRRGRSVRRYVAILFVKLFQFGFRRFRDLVDVIGGVERGDVRFHRAVRRFERFRHVARRGDRIRERVFRNGARVRDLFLQEVEKSAFAQTAGIKGGLPRFVVQSAADETLQLLRRGGVVRGHSILVRELQNQPTVDHRLRIVQREFQLGRETVERVSASGHFLVFFGQRANIKLNEVRLGNELRHLRRLIPRFDVQREERRSSEPRQTSRVVARRLERQFVERSVFGRFRDGAVLRSVLLSAGSDALHHRAQRDERKHRKESKPRHPSLLIAAENAKRVMFCHLNYLS